MDISAPAASSKGAPGASAEDSSAGLLQRDQVRQQRHSGVFRDISRVTTFMNN